MSLSRRNFIKGVIAGGAVTSSAGYLFRSSGVLGQTSSAWIRRAADHAERQRPEAARRRDEAGNAGDDAALQAGADRHQARLRPRRVRRVHGAHRRCAALFVLGADAHGARTRRSVTIEGLASADGHAASGAAGRRRRAGLPVRVLHAGLRDGRGRLPEDESESDARGAGARRSRAICAAARTTTRFSPR